MNHQTVSEREAVETARRLHAEHLVIDSLSPSVLDEWVLTPEMGELARAEQARGQGRPQIKAALSDYLLAHCETDPAMREAYLAYWARSGVTACNNTLYASGHPDRAWDDTMREFARIERLIEALGGAVLVATKAGDVEQAFGEKRLAVIHHLQNAEPLGGDLNRLDTLYEMGLRGLQLTYNLRTRYGEGCLEPHDGGVSRLGEALIGRMNELGMMVDASHGSPQNAIDAARLSGRPIIASHTAVRALSGHARGLSDEAFKAIAQGGGYVGVATLPAFLVTAAGSARAKAAGKPHGWVTLDDVADHVLYLVNLIGEEHVGIGTDWGKPYYSAITWTASMVGGSSGFDWVGWRPRDRFDPNAQVVGMETWDHWPNLTATLLRRGLSEHQVCKLIGGNFLRVFRDICG
jgi:membrane dipeptidase